MKTVLIYGDLWTDCHTMKAFISRDRLISARICESVSDLLHKLSHLPQACLILCLRPHEHVYLFYNIRCWLKKRKVLIVTDRMYYSDQCVVRYFGLSQWLERDELIPFIFPERSGNAPSGGWGRFMRPRLNGDVAGAAEKGEGDGEIGEDSILSRLNLYARWNLPAGVKETRYTLLLQLASCRRAVELAAQLNMSPKTVSIYRRDTMFRLNMEPSLVSLYRGLKVLKQLQRTPLMAEYGNLSEKA
ncbi:TPA: transcriptional regulator [Salmonella enterica subsp. enterica]|nr:transcriptional regulator [Salmonella enterica subsp. salamae]HAK5655356.1 transcriptional regulator [Salmonella enterica]